MSCLMNIIFLLLMCIPQIPTHMIFLMMVCHLTLFTIFNNLLQPLLLSPTRQLGPTRQTGPVRPPLLARSVPTGPATGAQRRSSPSFSRPYHLLGRPSLLAQVLLKSLQLTHNSVPPLLLLLIFLSNSLES